MGKRKKGKVEIKGSPLQAITIGEIKEHKYGWIGTMILFALFMGIVYYLPELFQLYQDYMGNGSGVYTPVSNNITNNTVNPPEEEVPIVLYKFTEKDSFEYDDFDITQIALADGILTYRVTNKKNEKIDLSSYDLYFELYNTFGDLDKTHYIVGYIEPGSYQDYSIENVTASYIEEYTLRNIYEDDYTYLDLTIDDNKVSILTCEYLTQSINYKFVDEQLKEINDTFSYLAENDDYMEKYNYYSNLTTNRAGIDSTITESATGFDYSMKIDYIKYTGKVENVHYFAVNSSPREVNFKMTSLGFSCH